MKKVTDKTARPRAYITPALTAVQIVPARFIAESDMDPTPSNPGSYARRRGTEITEFYEDELEY